MSLTEHSIKDHTVELRRKIHARVSVANKAQCISHRAELQSETHACVSVANRAQCISHRAELQRERFMPVSLSLTEHSASVTEQNYRERDSCLCVSAACHSHCCLLVRCLGRLLSLFWVVTFSFLMLLLLLPSKHIVTLPLTHTAIFLWSFHHHHLLPSCQFCTKQLSNMLGLPLHRHWYKSPQNSQ